MSDQEEVDPRNWEEIRCRPAGETRLAAEVGRPLHKPHWTGAPPVNTSSTTCSVPAKTKENKTKRSFILLYLTKKRSVFIEEFRSSDSFINSYLIW